MSYHLSLGQRISLGFILLSGIVLAVTGLGLRFSNSVVATGDLVQESTTLYQKVDVLEHTWSDITTTIDRMLLTRQTGGFIEEDLESALSLFNDQLAELQTATQTDESRLLLNNEDDIETLQRLGTDLVVLVEEIKTTAQAQRWAQAQVLRHTEMTSKQRRFDDRLASFRNQFQAIITESLAEQVNQQNRLRFTWIVAAVLAAVGGSLSGYYTWRSTVGPVKQLIAQTGQIMERDFRSITPLPRQDEIGQLSQAFAQMTDWLRESYEGLEQLVSDRTRALEASTEISRRLSTILNVQELVTEVVNEIRTTFDYYHAHIYLLDERNEYLVMMGGTGEAGIAMLAAGHKLELNQGLVGQAATTQEAVLIADVAQDANWLPNPLLPETKSELAVPIMMGDTALGVLDVQQNRVGGLDEEDVRLLQSVASQVAVALRNARLYEQAQKQAQQEAFINEIGQRIQTAADIETVLRVATRELRQALDVSRASVQLSVQQPGNGRIQGRN